MRTPVGKTCCRERDHGRSDSVTAAHRGQRVLPMTMKRVLAGVTGAIILFGCAVNGVVLMECSARVRAT
jgi:hypothetical protein